MNETDANIPATTTTRNVGQFKSNVDFHKHKHQSDDDSAFLGYRQRRPWMKPKGSINELRRERQLLLTLLSSQDNCPIDCVEKLIVGDIGFRDLLALSDKDLELIGFKSSKQRSELLKIFEDLPNQNPTYENICKMPEAKTYNNQILSHAVSHLEIMRASLIVTFYKMQIMPIEDVVVGDKRYASHFELESLSSVQGLSNELVHNLNRLKVARDLVVDKKKTMSRHCNDYIIWLNTFALGIAGAALFMLWYKKNH